MKRLLIRVVLFLAFAAPNLFAAEQASNESRVEASDVAHAYWQRHREGWFWYDDPPIERAGKQNPKRVESKSPSIAKPPELIEHETLVKRLEDLKNIAFINPTERNIKAYLDLQTEVVQRASYFADVWQRVVWANPYMDFTVQGRPMNAAALEVYDRQKEHATTDLLTSLAQTHVLFFFFRSDCPYCHRFAPLLKTFEAKHGLKIYPISMDGGALPDFPHPNLDNGISNTLNVRMVPTLFLASPGKAEIIPLGAGILSETELLQRIATAVKPLDAEPALTRASAAPK